jgi:hypothetical protein
VPRCRQRRRRWRRRPPAQRPSGRGSPGCRRRRRRVEVTRHTVADSIVIDTLRPLPTRGNVVAV